MTASFLKVFIGYANALEIAECEGARIEMARKLEGTIASIKVQAVKGNP